MNKRLLLGMLILLCLNLVSIGLASADFSVSNFRMSDRPNGPKVDKFPSGVKTVHVAFDYKDAQSMPIQVRVYNPRGDVIFQETRNYTGTGSESMAITSDIPLPDGEYVTNIFTRPELYITQTVEWVVGNPVRPTVEPKSAAQPQQKPSDSQAATDKSNAPQPAVPANAPPAVSDTGVPAGIVLGGGVLILALLGLVAWAVRGFLTAS